MPLTDSYPEGFGFVLQCAGEEGHNFFFEFAQGDDTAPRCSHCNETLRITAVIYRNREPLLYPLEHYGRLLGELYIHGPGFGLIATSTATLQSILDEIHTRFS